MTSRRGQPDATAAFVVRCVLACPQCFVAANVSSVISASHNHAVNAPRHAGAPQDGPSRFSRACVLRLTGEHAVHTVAIRNAIK